MVAATVCHSASRTARTDTTRRLGATWYNLSFDEHNELTGGGRRRGGWELPNGPVLPSDTAVESEEER